MLRRSIVVSCRNFFSNVGEHQTLAAAQRSGDGSSFTAGNIVLGWEKQLKTKIHSKYTRGALEIHVYCVTCYPR